MEGLHKTQYFKVHFDSFGRQPSREDITGSDGDLKSNNLPGEPQLDQLETSLAETAAGGDSGPERGRLRRALHTLKGTRKSPSRPPPPITVSSPTLRVPPSEKCVPPMPPLRHAGTTVDIHAVSVAEQAATHWLKSQSMQDVHKLSPEAGSGTESLAQSDDSPNRSRPQSAETLHPWQLPDPLSDEIVAEQPMGQVHFTASYSPKNRKLFVHVDSLEKLPALSICAPFEAVVRLCVLPDKGEQVTGPLSGWPSPLVDEDFYFDVREPAGHTLRLSVYDVQHQGKFDAVGHALFPVEGLLGARPKRYNGDLLRQTHPGHSSGALQVSLHYGSDRLAVLVLQARELKPPTRGHTCAKVALYSAGRKVKTKHSVSVAHSSSPQYNQSFKLPLPQQHRDDSYVVLSVMARGLLQETPVGRVILGPFLYAGDHSITPWGRTLLQGEEICQWFPLYL